MTNNIEQEASLTGKILGKTTLRGRLQPEVILSAKASIYTSTVVKTEEITVTPTNTIQEVFPSDGKFFDKVTVGAIPKNYGLITYNGFEITVS